MTYQIVTVDKYTEVKCIDLDFGCDERLRDDFLDILKKSDSYVTFTIKTDDTLGSNLIRIEIYYNDNNME